MNIAEIKAHLEGTNDFLTAIDCNPRAFKALLTAIDALESIGNSAISADDAHACDHPSDAREALAKIENQWNQ